MSIRGLLSPRKDVRQFLDWARERGWQPEYTGSGHIRLVHPQAGVTFMGSTPRSGRALDNQRSLLLRLERQAGLPGRR